MRIKIFLLLCISSVFYTSLLAQQTERDRAIYNQFLRPQDVKWIKHFFGRIDDFSDISIILAYDGKECKGRMEYLKSKDVFDLSGTLDENYNLNVKEYDKNKNLTGSIKGSISNGFLEGDWSNNNNTIGGILSLEELPDESRLPNFCGDNKWIRSYRGALQREEMKMILQKDGLNQIRGIAFKNKETYSINGEMSLDSTLVLTLTDNDDKHFGDIQATFLKDKDDIRAIFYNDNGERSYASYEEELEMHFICNEYADYTTSYQITYPKYNNENFNKYIEHIATPWLQECRKKVEQNRNEFSNTPPPNSRASTRGSAWCDIEYLNKKIISGFIVFSNTWTDSITCHSFNFDFLQNKEIKLDDILNNIPARDVFIDRYISSQVTALPQYTQRAFRDWIDEVDFSYFTIRQDGICFSTPYNTIFGQQHISIPYDKLKDFLKKSYTTLLSDKNND